MTNSEKALKMHEEWHGKIETCAKSHVNSREDLAIAYTPGVAEPCKVIAKDPEAAYTYTMKSNTVAVVSDGSAVLGLGNIGALAAMPVMEGKAVLFKEFGGVNAVPICLDTQDTEEIIKTVVNIAPAFGGINLEDISAPRCFEIEERLKELLDIPVFHDDQHGTAIVVLAGIINALKVTGKKKEDCNCMQPPVIVATRPRELEADVVKFQNNREKWIAFVGLLNGRPYEIFTGLADDDEGIMLPKNVSKGSIIKSYDEDGKKHYDFQFKNKRGYKMTIEGLDGKFNPEFWNYAKLISGVLRYRMPIDHVIKLVGSLQLKDESINTWKNGVERALKKYITDGTKAVGQKCPVCGQETLVYQEGCLICTNCGASRCG